MGILLVMIIMWIIMRRIPYYLYYEKVKISKRCA